MTKMANFENSTWRMAAILITFFSTVNHPILMKFGTRTPILIMIKNQYFLNPRWRMDAILKDVFRLYLSTILSWVMRNFERGSRIALGKICDLNGKFRNLKVTDDHQVLKMVVCLYLTISPISIKFVMHMCSLIRRIVMWTSF